MLNVQRQREKPRSAPAILFTRVLIGLILLSSLGAAVLLALHELFFGASFAATWFLLAVLVVLVMAGRHQWGRILFGLLLLIGSMGALFMLMWVIPTLGKESADVLLTRQILPFWLTLIAAAFGGASLCVFVSKKVHRATRKGFSLFETVADPDYD
jgi:glucan phosphoethanolaminetransferase (alkaline phosphatase superfamily)